MEQRIISREEARAQGLTHYRTGDRCAQGHRASRYVNSGKCSVCHRVRRRLRYAADPQKERESRRRWVRENPKKARESRRRWQRENPEKASRWARENPDHFAAIQGRSNSLRRAPGCLPADFDFEATIPLYAEARRLTRETGVVHHVDHIIPLLAGGLHCASNLQVLSAQENLRKAREEDQELIEAYRAQQEQTELQTA
jgi:hypothetical protein